MPRLSREDRRAWRKTLREERREELVSEADDQIDQAAELGAITADEAIHLKARTRKAGDWLAVLSILQIVLKLIAEWRSRVEDDEDLVDDD